MKRKQRIPIIIADDHPLVRIGLRVVLEDSHLYRVAAECSSAAESLIYHLEQEPNLAAAVILDLKMPQKEGDDSGANEPGPVNAGFLPVRGQFVGLGLLKAIRRSWPDLKILVLTEQKDPAVIASARDLGADGYLFKDEMVDNVIQTLERILTDEHAFSSSAQTALTWQSSGTGGLSLLTPRESQVLELLVEGLRDKEICARLGLAPRTVAFHKANLREKLGAETTAELIAIYHTGRKQK